MATKTEELKTVLTMDTKGYKQGGKEAARVHSDLIEGERKVRTNLKGLVGDLGNVSSFSDGAVMSIERLSEVFKTGLAGGIAIAVASKAYEVFSESAEKAAAQVDELNKGFAENRSETRYASSAQGASAIQDKITKLKAYMVTVKQAMHEQRTVEDMPQISKSPMGWARAQEGYLNLVERIKTAGKEMGNLFIGGIDPTSQSDDIKQIAQLTEQSIKRLEAEKKKALKEDIQLAKDALANDTSALKIKEIEKKQTLEINEARKNGADSEEIDLITQKYNVQKDIIQKQIDLFDNEIALQQESLSINRNVVGIEAKRYDLAQATLNTALNELKIARDRKDFDSDAVKKAQLRADAAADEMHSMERAVFLQRNPATAAHKRLHSQYAQERRQRRAEEKEKESLGLIDVARDSSGAISGGINPLTGEWEDKSAGHHFKPSELTRPFGDLEAHASLSHYGRGDQSKRNSRRKNDDDWASMFLPKSSAPVESAGSVWVDIKSILQNSHDELKRQTSLIVA